MRLFVALYPPEPALDHLSAAVRRLRLGAAAARGTNVRLAARPLWHVTLGFLGEIADDRGPDVEAALAAGVARWTAVRSAAPASAPMLRLAGGGRFGRGRSTVLWVGVTGDVPELLGLEREVRRALRRARFPQDRKPYRPHLTFARPGDRLPRVDVAADLAALAAYEGPVWPAGELVLVRSHLGAKPVHEPLAAVPLG